MGDQPITWTTLAPDVVESGPATAVTKSTPDHGRIMARGAYPFPVTAPRPWPTPHMGRVISSSSRVGSSSRTGWVAPVRANPRLA